MSINSAQSPIKVSSNDKQDFLEVQLKRYIIAVQILESHGLINEFKRAIGAPAPIPKVSFGEELVNKTY